MILPEAFVPPSTAEEALQTARMFGKHLGAVMLQPERQAEVPSAYATQQQALDVYARLRRQQPKLSADNPLQTS